MATIPIPGLIPPMAVSSSGVAIPMSQTEVTPEVEAPLKTSEDSDAIIRRKERNIRKAQRRKLRAKGHPAGWGNPVKRPKR